MTANKNIKKVLIHAYKHERPLFAVLIRYNIGSIDKYDRGRWITEKDLPKIREAMSRDSSYRDWYGDPMVDGTCIHNQVTFSEFVHKLGC